MLADSSPLAFLLVVSLIAGVAWLLRRTNKE